MKTGVFITLVVIMISLQISTCGTATNSQGSVKLLLLLDSTETVPYQSIFAVLKISNGSRDPVELQNPFPKGLEFLSSYDGEPFVFVGDGSQSERDVVPRCFQLKPGESLSSYNEQLFWYRSPRTRKNEYVFNKPGKFLLKAAVRLADGSSVQSNAVEITVKKPSQEEADASQLFTELKAVRIIKGYDFKKENADLLHRLVSEYPRSSYADSARYALGDYYSLPCSRKRLGDLAALGKAIECYSTVSDRVPALRLRALLRAAELVRDFTEVREIADIPKLVKELKDRDNTAKAIGLETKAAELREKLKILSKSELKK